MKDLHLQRQPNSLNSKGRHTLLQLPKYHKTLRLSTNDWAREENVEEDMQIRSQLKCKQIAKGWLWATAIVQNHWNQRPEFTLIHRLHSMKTYKELLGKTGSKETKQPERISLGGAGMKERIRCHWGKDMKSHLLPRHYSQKPWVSGGLAANPVTPRAWVKTHDG